MNLSDLGLIRPRVKPYFGRVVVRGDATNPSAGQVICETGALAEGIYDVYYAMSYSNNVGFPQLCFTWRDAANAAWLWLDSVAGVGAGSVRNALDGVYVFASERFRIEAITAYTGVLSGTIATMRRF